MFPANFSSQKEYDNYLACLSNLKIGDKLIATSRYGDIHGFFLYKEGDTRTSNSWVILVGTEDFENRLYHLPTALEKRRYLSPAKKFCSKIRIGSTRLFWLPGDARILKIVKYNGEQEEKEKKEKAKAAKSLRASRKYAEQCGPNETQAFT